MKLPTTLLAEIDAGIGIKTGVNFRQNKNRLGTFTAPYAVVVRSLFSQNTARAADTEWIVRIFENCLDE